MPSGKLSDLRGKVTRWLSNGCISTAVIFHTFSETDFRDMQLLEEYLFHICFTFIEQMFLVEQAGEQYDKIQINQPEISIYINSSGENDSSLHFMPHVGSSPANLTPIFHPRSNNIVTSEYFFFDCVSQMLLAGLLIMIMQLVTPILGSTGNA